MRCQKCGKEIAADSRYCCICGVPRRCEHPRNGSFGKKLINAAIIAGIIAASGTILALIMYQNKLNPVLNSPEDITDNLISDIIANRLESLTINYEFAGCPLPLEKTISRNESDYE